MKSNNELASAMNEKISVRPNGLPRGAPPPPPRSSRRPIARLSGVPGIQPLAPPPVQPAPALARETPLPPPLPPAPLPLELSPPPAEDSLFPEPIAEEWPSANTIDVDAREVELVSLPPPRPRSLLPKLIVGGTLGACLTIMALAAPRLLQKRGQANAMPQASMVAAIPAPNQIAANAAKTEGTVASPPPARHEQEASATGTTSAPEAPSAATKKLPALPRALPRKPPRNGRKAP
jgi:hypothetical protein